MAFPILQTKLYAPPVRAGLIPRPRLLDALNAGLWTRPGAGRAEFARKLTLVAAPAGFGKTTVVADWLAGVASAVGWLSLDQGDNNPARFIAYVLAALQSAFPGLGQEAQAALALADVAALDNVLALLLNDIAAAPQPVFLVLDDYHVIHDAHVTQLLAWLVERQPPSLHLVIVSRADPGLPVARLRVRGQMVELRAPDLRFTFEEAGAFLQTMGLTLPYASIAALEQRTEGWIAGLQLAALSLQGRDDVEAFVRAFSGSHHYVIDYLVDEVLRQQPPDVREFLVQTAILERLCAPLCDAVLAAHDSQATLKYLEHANLFLIPLDDRREWYRYHPLFADALLTELDEPQGLALHRRAAVWHAGHHLLPQAVHHALTGQDYEHAADLLGASGGDAALWSSGDFQRYCDWVRQVPDAVRRGRPRLQLAYARALQIAGGVAEAERILAGVAQALEAAPVVDANLAANTSMYQAYIQLEQGEVQVAHGLAERAAAHLSTASPLEQARVRLCLAGTHYGLGRYDAALPLFEQVSRSTESVTAALNAGECAARTLVLQGRLRAAEQQCTDLFAAARLGNTYNVLAAGAFVTLGEIYYQQNLLEQVPAALQQGIEVADRLGPRSLVRAHQVWAYLRLARLGQVQGDAAGAADALRRADAIAKEMQNTFYLRLAALRRKADALALEHNAPLLRQVRVYLPVTFSSLTDYETWIAIYLALAQERPQHALALLDQMLASAQKTGHGLNVLDIQIWRALLCRRLGQAADARTALTHALTLGAPEGSVRLFLDAGAELAGLLQSVRAVAPEHVDRLLAALDATPSAAPVPGVPSAPASVDVGHAALNLQVDPLSEREIEILGLLAAGLSNQEIGHQLFIGIGTVKWYLNNLYSKLTVRSRTQAVARARQLGLIP